jgi:hypothetical protein
MENQSSDKKPTGNNLNIVKSWSAVKHATTVEEPTGIQSRERRGGAWRRTRRTLGEAHK